MCVPSEFTPATTTCMETLHGGSASLRLKSLPSDSFRRKTKISSSIFVWTSNSCFRSLTLLPLKLKLSSRSVEYLPCASATVKKILRDPQDGDLGVSGDTFGNFLSSSVSSAESRCLVAADSMIFDGFLSLLMRFRGSAPSS